MGTADHHHAVPTVTPGTTWGRVATSQPETPIGYAALCRDLGITNYIPVHQSALAQNASTRGRPPVVDTYGRTHQVLAGTTAAPRNTITDHLFAAVRYDGIDLEALRLTFAQINEKELTTAIQAAQSSIPARQCWFLYEWITGKTLDLNNLQNRARHVPLFDPNTYVTCEQTRSARHGIIVNGLGVAGLCPTIRRTAAWEAATATKPLAARDRLAVNLDVTTEERINSFLATRESHSTYAIEGEQSSPKNDDIFYALLKQCTARDQLLLSKSVLCYLQSTLLHDHLGTQRGCYRTHQIWVGDRVGDRAVPHHIAPKAADVPAFMDAFCHIANSITTASRTGAIDPIAGAVVTSGLLAYIHPFDDGNGRVGRLLLQQPLTNTTENRRLYIPVSAAINRRREAYYDSLDAWSKPLLGRIKFDHVQGGVAVTNDTTQLYRFPDVTRYAEFIAEACSEAVTKDLVEEQQTLAVYDLAHQHLQRSGLGDRQAHLFFKLSLQNKWKISKRKERFFPELTQQDFISLSEKLESAANKAGLGSRAPAIGKV